jgi:hypothetical protein
MILGYVVNSKWKTKYQSLCLIDSSDFSRHFIKDEDKIYNCELLYTLGDSSYFLYNILKNEIIIPQTKEHNLFLEPYIKHFKSSNISIYHNQNLKDFFLVNNILTNSPDINYFITTINQLQNNTFDLDAVLSKTAIELRKYTKKYSEDYGGRIYINTDTSILKNDTYLLSIIPTLNHNLAFVDVPTWGNTKDSAYNEMINEVGEHNIVTIENELKKLNNSHQIIIKILYNKHYHLSSLEGDFLRYKFK